MNTEPFCTLRKQPAGAQVGGECGSPARLPTNVARNSHVNLSNLEITSLELQRFLTWLNLRPIELHATFGGALAVRRRLHTGARGAWRVVRGARRILLLPRAKHLFPRTCPSGPIGIGCAHLDRLCASG